MHGAPREDSSFPPDDERRRLAAGRRHRVPGTGPDGARDATSAALAARTGPRARRVARRPATAPRRSPCPFRTSPPHTRCAPAQEKT
ncbi:hypothetical protein GCM10027168_26640 [Streptomyces capparidis]